MPVLPVWEGAPAWPEVPILRQSSSSAAPNPAASKDPFPTNGALHAGTSARGNEGWQGKGTAPERERTQSCLCTNAIS